QVTWSEFWGHLNTTHVSEEGLMIAWYRVINEAANELSGGTTYLIAKPISDDCIRENMLAESAKIGEPGELRLVDGQGPSHILNRYSELLKSKGIRIPSSMHRPRGARAWSQ